MSFPDRRDVGPPCAIDFSGQCHDSVGEGVVDSVYHYMWLHRKRLHTQYPGVLNIPDTVVYRYGTPITWYFTSKKDGSLKRKRQKNLNASEIFRVYTKGGELLRTKKVPTVDVLHGDVSRKALLTRSETTVCDLSPRRTHLQKSRRGAGSEERRGSGILAVFVARVFDDAAGQENTHFEYLDELTFEDFLFHQDKGTGLLQRFVEPKGNSNSVIRAVWSPHSFDLECRRNNFPLHDVSYAPFHRAATFEGSHIHSSTVPVKGSVLSRRIEEVSSVVVECIREGLSKSGTVRYLVDHFKVDQHGRVWMLWCSSLRITNESGKGEGYSVCHQCNRLLRPVGRGGERFDAMISSWSPRSALLKEMQEKEERERKRAQEQRRRRLRMVPLLAGNAFGGGVFGGRSVTGVGIGESMASLSLSARTARPTELNIPAGFQSGMMRAAYGLGLSTYCANESAAKGDLRDMLKDFNVPSRRHTVDHPGSTPHLARRSGSGGSLHKTPAGPKPSPPAAGGARDGSPSANGGLHRGNSGGSSRRSLRSHEGMQSGDREAASDRESGGSATSVTSATSSSLAFLPRISQHGSSKRNSSLMSQQPFSIRESEEEEEEPVAGGSRSREISRGRLSPTKEDAKEGLTLSRDQGKRSKEITSDEDSLGEADETESGGEYDDDDYDDESEEEVDLPPVPASQSAQQHSDCSLRSSHDIRPHDAQDCVDKDSGDVASAEPEPLCAVDHYDPNDRRDHNSASLQETSGRSPQAIVRDNRLSKSSITSSSGAVGRGPKSQSSTDRSRPGDHRHVCSRTSRSGSGSGRGDNNISRGPVAQQRKKSSTRGSYTAR